MYAYITGIVAEKGHNELVIETGGIGYQLMCSMNTVQNAVSVGESMRVYTYLNVRQDGLDLFGFESREEREMFLRLTGVSGIGPRKPCRRSTPSRIKAIKATSWCGWRCAA